MEQPARSSFGRASNQIKEMASQSFGKVYTVSGGQAVVRIDIDCEVRPQLGQVWKILTPQSEAYGVVSGLKALTPENGSPEFACQVAELDLVGERRVLKNGQLDQFRRGLSLFPSFGDDVYLTDTFDLEAIYCQTEGDHFRLGSLHQDRTRPAYAFTDSLLEKHFAILGSTGVGKSCSIALMLGRILEQHPNAHVLLLDPHDEYRHSFGDKSLALSFEDIQLPFWMLNFEELKEVYFQGEEGIEPEVEILRDIVVEAKYLYSGSENLQKTRLIRRQRDAHTHYTVDTPTPYRLSDMVALIEDSMGRLEKAHDVQPYRRLKARVEAMQSDVRYDFMFGGLAVRDQMVEIVSTLFRVPVAGKPITILNLSNVPCEIVNVVASVIARLTFEFVIHSEQEVPVLLVCEEAHRYIPSDPTLGFEPTRRAIARIAKEGRKYGISLCLVSQRPSELDATILSQCSTILSFRLTNQADQQFVKATMSETGLGLLDILPSMGDGEAIVVGSGVSLPMRVCFDLVPEELRPRNLGGDFSKKWNKDLQDSRLVANSVRRWRRQLEDEFG